VTTPTAKVLSLLSCRRDWLPPVCVDLFQVGPSVKHVVFNTSRGGVIAGDDVYRTYDIVYQAPPPNLAKEGWPLAVTNAGEWITLSNDGRSSAGSVPRTARCRARRRTRCRARRRTRCRARRRTRCRARCMTRCRARRRTRCRARRRTRCRARRRPSRMSRSLEKLAKAAWSQPQEFGFKGAIISCGRIFVVLHLCS
jgi:hypothetical protein